MSIDIGYCTSCKHHNCPTPKVQKVEGGNCSHWTNHAPMPDINEHDECSQCGNIMTTTAGHYPLRCQVCEFQLEAVA